MSNNIGIGDIVTRISHGGDILFKVTDLVEEGEIKGILRGLDVRLYADAPLNDLEKKNPSEISKMRQEYIKKNSERMRRIFERRIEDKTRIFLRDSMYKGMTRSVNQEHYEIPGTVLHMDGDKDYLDLCKATYSQLNVPAYGYLVSENQQPQEVVQHLKEHRPDILVLTGHDGLLKDSKEFKDVNSYRNSKFFIEAVRKAREYEPSRDNLIIFAGACQSHYEALIEAGANFASSPQRVLIHAFDPVFIVEKLAFGSIFDTISLQDIIQNTITGIDGVGGIETRGCLRLGFPKSPY